MGKKRGKELSNSTSFKSKNTLCLRSLLERLVLEIEVDIISNLPEEILLHILSLMPPVYAVRTCVLSSRWKLLWTLLPELVFKETTVLSTGHYNRVKFMNFVDGVFVYYNPSCLRCVSISCLGEINKYRLSSWINIAVKNGIKEISLDVGLTHLDQLPRSLFTCKSLVRLRLSNAINLDLPELVHLPCLEILDLSMIFPRNLIQNFSNSCPVLKTLSLKVSSLDFGGRTFNISLPTLKKVKIELNPFYKFKNMFVIEAPFLEELYLFGICLRDCVLKIPSSVKIAFVSFANPNELCCEPIHLDKAFLLLKAITNVEILNLDDETMKGLAIADEKYWPIFPNLIHLEVHVQSKSSFELLSVLLSKVPRLEKLHFTNLCPLEQPSQLKWYEPREWPSYVQTSLKQIKFMVKGCQADLNPIEYFLGNAGALRKLTINCEIATWEGEDEFYGKLMNLPRCSQACDIVFDNTLGKANNIWKPWL